MAGRSRAMAKTGGVRFYRSSTFGKPFFYDPKDKNLDALMRCQLSHLMPVTPNIYHGCVSQDYLDKTAPKSGDYFDSAIPDVNFEYRSIMFGGNFLHADHPFTINGYSPASTGGAHNKKHVMPSLIKLVKHLSLKTRLIL